MKIHHLLLTLTIALLAAFATMGCAKSDDVDNRETGYGYVQFKLYKKGTRADINQLEYLRDAAKMKASFLYQNKNIEITLILNSADENSAEFGLRSETAKLLVGDYELIGYTLYNSVDEYLAGGSPSNTAISIRQSELTVEEVEINVVPRGFIEFTLVKDLTEANAAAGVTRAAAETHTEYTFDEIKTFSIGLVNAATNRAFDITGLKGTFSMSAAKDDNGKAYVSSVVSCDSTIVIPAGTYRLKSFTLTSKNNEILEYANTFAKTTTYTIEDNKVCKADVPVVIGSTQEYIKDYIALKKIWEALDGENWYWRGDAYTDGINWDFNRDVDLWGDQPGVGLHDNGRVGSLNIGGFNPKGFIPDELGQLTELVELYVGNHNDTMTGSSYIGETYGFSSLNPYVLSLRGERFNRTAQSRMQYAKAYAAATHPRNAKAQSELIAFEQWRKQQPNPTSLSKAQMKTWDTTWAARKATFANGSSTYATVDYGYATNGITGITDQIGKLTKLETLFFANSLITELPATIANCTSVTDLEIFNCSKMTKFPMAIAQMPSLVLVNISNNRQMTPKGAGSASEMYKGLDALFQGPSADKLQIIYATDGYLEAFPESCKNLKKLGLLDLSLNNIKEMPSFGKNVAIVQLLLDNNHISKLCVDAEGYFCNMNDMESLSLSENRFTKFPNVFNGNTYFIGSVDFSGNRITEVEGEADGTFKPMRASTLNLSTNSLKGAMPKAFSNSKSEITNFNFSYNKLDSIGGAGLVGMKGTEALDFSSNHISDYPRGENNDFMLGVECPFITGIDVSFNNFDEFPVPMFNGYGIVSFFFTDQMDETGEKCYTGWPTGIEQYAGLRVLKMSNNDIRAVSKCPTLLNYLSIDGNPNISIEIPDAICSRIQAGTFVLVYETSQKGITGCSALGIDD